MQTNAECTILKDIKLLLNSIQTVYVHFWSAYLMYINSHEVKMVQIQPLFMMNMMYVAAKVAAIKLHLLLAKIVSRSACTTATNHWFSHEFGAPTIFCLATPLW